MKKKLLLLGLLSFLMVSCKEDDTITASAPPPPPIVEDTINIQEEINSIVWDKLYGRGIYIKKGKYLLLNKNDSSVKIIGDYVGLLNIKYNPFGTLITGMDLDNSNMNKLHFHLLASDLNGNQSRLYPNIDFETEFYDWLPDGRLVHFNKSGKVYIDGTALNTPTISPSYNIACSPTENIIFVCTSKCDSAYYCYFQIIKIDIATGEQIPITTNIYSLFQNKYSEMPVMNYSPTTGCFLCAVIDHSAVVGGTSYYLSATPNYLIKENASYPNWCPSDWEQLTYTYMNDTYWRHNCYGAEVLVIPDGQMIAWFN